MVFVSSLTIPIPESQDILRPSPEFFYKKDQYPHRPVHMPLGHHLPGGAGDLGQLGLVGDEFGGDAGILHLGQQGVNGIDSPAIVRK